MTNLLLFIITTSDTQSRRYINFQITKHKIHWDGKILHFSAIVECACLVGNEEKKNTKLNKQTIEKQVDQSFTFNWNLLTIFTVLTWVCAQCSNAVAVLLNILLMNMFNEWDVFVMFVFIYVCCSVVYFNSF